MKSKADKKFDGWVKGLTESKQRWLFLREHGGCDPFWSDGVNMNLVRNHIIYYRKHIEEACFAEGRFFPEEYFDVQIPPEVPNNYMAENGEHLERRLKSIFAFMNDGPTFEKPPLPIPSNELSLF